MQKLDTSNLLGSFKTPPKPIVTSTCKIAIYTILPTIEKIIKIFNMELPVFRDHNPSFAPFFILKNNKRLTMDANVEITIPIVTILYVN